MKEKQTLPVTVSLTALLLRTAQAAANWEGRPVKPWMKVVVVVDKNYQT